MTREGLITGTVSVGGVTAEDLQGQLKDKSLKDLYMSMIDGRIYVTVHTEDFPNGEIRGDSFIPIDRVFPDIWIPAGIDICHKLAVSSLIFMFIG